MTKVKIDASTEIQITHRYPGMYSVIFINDDYTPMEFVIDLLQMIFSKDLEAATRIMLEIHHQGQAVVGSYVKDIAETKMRQVLSAAINAGHPLKCILEQA